VTTTNGNSPARTPVRTPSDSHAFRAEGGYIQRHNLVSVVPLSTDNVATGEFFGPYEAFIAECGHIVPIAMLMSHSAGPPARPARCSPAQCFQPTPAAELGSRRLFDWVVQRAELHLERRRHMPHNRTCERYCAAVWVAGRVRQGRAGTPCGGLRQCAEPGLVLARP
jgi:hypothetical protein